MLAAHRPPLVRGRPVNGRCCCSRCCTTRIRTARRTTRRRSCTARTGASTRRRWRRSYRRAGTTTTTTSRRRAAGGDRLPVYSAPTAAAEFDGGGGRVRRWPSSTTVFNRRVRWRRRPLSTPVAAIFDADGGHVGQRRPRWSAGAATFVGGGCGEQTHWLSSVRNCDCRIGGGRNAAAATRSGGTEVGGRRGRGAGVTAFSSVFSRCSTSRIRTVRRTTSPRTCIRRTGASTRRR